MDIQHDTSRQDIRLIDQQQHNARINNAGNHANSQVCVFAFLYYPNGNIKVVAAAGGAAAHLQISGIEMFENGKGCEKPTDFIGAMAYQNATDPTGAKSVYYPYKLIITTTNNANIYGARMAKWTAALGEGFPQPGADEHQIGTYFRPIHCHGHQYGWIATFTLHNWQQIGIYGFWIWIEKKNPDCSKVNQYNEPHASKTIRSLVMQKFVCLPIYEDEQGMVTDYIMPHAIPFVDAGGNTYGPRVDTKF